jgi:hypothetical protein
MITKNSIDVNIYNIICFDLLENLIDINVPVSILDCGESEFSCSLSRKTNSEDKEIEKRSNETDSKYKLGPNPFS